MTAPGKINIPISVSTRLQFQHESLPDLISGLTDAQLRMQVVAGKWSIFETIVHLQTYQHTFVNRLQRMIKEDGPVFTAYVAEADPLFHDSCTGPTAHVLQDLFATRVKIFSLVNAFDKAEFARTGLHPAYGNMDVLKWINFFLLHEAHHLLAIFKLSAALKNSPGVH
jgi:uncharacterized damage-inducible protein DinB